MSKLKKWICKNEEHGEVTDMWDPGDIFWGGTIQVFYHQALKVKRRLELKHDLGGAIKGQLEYKASVLPHSPE